MDKIRVIHDVSGRTLTVWLDDPGKEHICEETTDEVVLMTAGIPLWLKGGRGCPHCGKD